MLKMTFIIKIDQRDSYQPIKFRQEIDSVIKCRHRNYLTLTTTKHQLTLNFPYTLKGNIELMDTLIISLQQQAWNMRLAKEYL